MIKKDTFYNAMNLIINRNKEMDMIIVRKHERELRHQIPSYETMPVWVDMDRVRDKMLKEIEHRIAKHVEFDPMTEEPMLEGTLLEYIRSAYTKPEKREPLVKNRYPGRLYYIDC